MGTGCQVSVLTPQPSLISFLTELLQMYFWLFMELAEKVLAALLGRVLGPGLHLWKPLRLESRVGICAGTQPI